jgi:putative transposase
MAKTEHYYTKFEEGHFYHIYNRTIDKQLMFRNNDNYRFFLERYHKYLSPVSDIFAYSLLGNHFHILLRIHDTFLQSSDFGNKTTHDVISHQFRKFFQSYAMAFNKQQQRVGTLFQTPFKRALITDNSYFTQIIYYIHANPQYHGLTSDFKQWPWSSYKHILSDKVGNLQRQQVIEWFGDKVAYQQYHNERTITDERLNLEDD